MVYPTALKMTLNVDDDYNDDDDSALLYYICNLLFVCFFLLS